MRFYTIMDSLKLLFEIRNKRKSIMELESTIRYNGFIRIMEMKKQHNRLEILLNIP